jgi:hypothetical protein
MPMETRTTLIRYFINDIDPKPTWAIDFYCDAQQHCLDVLEFRSPAW